MDQRHCLVVDDDRITAAFLLELVTAQGLIVEIAPTLREADLRRSHRQYDILLVDRRLPDGDGVRWLTRVVAAADPSQIPRAMLISGDSLSSADLPTGVAWLRKPIEPEHLCLWLAAVGGPAPGQAPFAAIAEAAARELLDDTRVLARFGGNQDALRALRAMLLTELADSTHWRAQLRLSVPPPFAMDALHRLRAACALTGCTRLGDLAEAIESQLRRGSPAPAQAIDELDGVVAATMAAIAGC